MIWKQNQILSIKIIIYLSFPSTFGRNRESKYMTNSYDFNVVAAIDHNGSPKETQLFSMRSQSKEN